MNFFRFGQWLLVICALILSGCKIDAVVEGQGTITSSSGRFNCSHSGGDCTQEYSTATTETFSATPAAGWRFVQWSGICNGETNPVCANTISQDNADTDNAANITAIFEDTTIRNIYIATTGDDGNDGLTINTPMKTLAEAHALVNFGGNLDNVIHIRGGTYEGESINWTNTHENFSVTIGSYEDEEPIFEGLGKSVLIKTLKTDGKPTNLIIDGLTIRHYIQYAIRFGSANTPQGSNSKNIVSNNTFEEIGNLYDTGNCADCKGFAAVDMFNSDENVIKGNIFSNIENTYTDRSAMHAVYFAHNSSNNKFYNNYINMTSGDPIRVRDDSNNNEIYDNYVTHSGFEAFISPYKGEGEKSCSGNMIDNNTVTFSYPSSNSIELIHYSKDPGSTYIDNGQTFFHGSRSTTEEVGATAAGDFDGDGRSELVVAFNYDDFTIVARSNGGSSRHLNNLLYVSPSFSIHEFATGDFKGSGSDQILTFFRLRANDKTFVYHGNGSSSLTSGGKIYTSTTWDVTAMTAGDFDGDGIDESVIALKASDNETRLYRGNGVSSILNLGKFYTSYGVWSVPAMTAGDFNNDGKDELISALHKSSETRIYRGNATSSALNYGYFYSSSSWDIPAMAAGNYGDGTTPQLVTAFKLKSTGKVDIYNGDTTSATGNRIYTSSSWDVSGLAAGVFGTGSSDMLTTAFTRPSATQIWAGNGTSSATSDKTFHRWVKP